MTDAENYDVKVPWPFPLADLLSTVKLPPKTDPPFPKRKRKLDEENESTASKRACKDKQLDIQISIMAGQVYIEGVSITDIVNDLHSTRRKLKEKESMVDNSVKELEETKAKLATTQTNLDVAWQKNQKFREDKERKNIKFAELEALKTSVLKDSRVALEKVAKLEAENASLEARYSKRKEICDIMDGAWRQKGQDVERSSESTKKSVGVLQAQVARLEQELTNEKTSNKLNREAAEELRALKMTLAWLGDGKRMCKVEMGTATVKVEKR